MAEKRRGLGRGLGALIPSAPTGDARPVDVFFPGAPAASAGGDATASNGSGSVRTVEEGTADPAGWPVPDNGAPVYTSDGLSDLQTAGDGGGQNGSGAAPESARGNDVADDGADRGDERPQQPSESAPGSSAVEPADDGELLPVPGVHFAEVPLDAIRPNPRQPRTVFDEDALEELVSSIREIGVLQPVVVRPVTDGTDGVRYELIMGERRWRATRAAGLLTVPAIVRETDDADLLRDALLENLHRSELNALEEAAADQQLLDDFGCTHDELARRIHRSRPQISNTLRLLKLPPLVQRRVAAGVLSAGHARALLGLPDAAAMERLAQRIVAEGLSVRATEEVVSLGGDPERPAPRRRPRPGDRNAALDDLALRLSDRFETRVKIALGKSKGRLTVEFASVQDLNRILATLSPEDPGLLR